MAGPLPLKRGGKNRVNRQRSFERKRKRKNEEREEKRSSLCEPCRVLPKVAGGPRAPKGRGAGVCAWGVIARQGPPTSSFPAAGARVAGGLARSGSPRAVPAQRARPCVAAARRSRACRVGVA